MRHSKISLTNEEANNIPYYDFDFSENNNDEISRMKKILSKAIASELTDRQRFCLSEFYLKGKTMKSIAQELNLNPSTITRHIKNAERRLKKIAECYS